MPFVYSLDEILDKLCPVLLSLESTNLSFFSDNPF